MKCPKCGNELRRSKKDPCYGLCDQCRKKYKWVEEDSEEKGKKKKLNIFLLISLIIGAAYVAYSVVYWSGAGGDASGMAEQIGAGIATALVAPHLVCTVVAVIFNALGFFMGKKGFALTGAILYTVAIALFPGYFMFVAIEAVLSYIGFARLPKTNQ